MKIKIYKPIYIRMIMIGISVTVEHDLEENKMLSTCTQEILFYMWKGHSLEVHCTNIQLKIFIK